MTGVVATAGAARLFDYRVNGTYRCRQQLVPYIPMSGQWLERLGFQSGDRIDITEERERLVLTVRRDDRELSIR